MYQGSTTVAAIGALAGIVFASSPIALAQTPVNDAGDSFDYAPQPGAEQDGAFGASIEMLGDDSIPILPARDLEELVGPVALYPDTLLAIVLPAAAYPLQIVQAARFLEQLESDPSLTPSPDWDESVVALLNYPEVLVQLDEDIDWTLRLGEAVIAQQADVLAAVQRFRDRAYYAGNLQSDGRQNVVRKDEIIEIAPVSESTIYVPYYEPETVVHRSSQPVYTYYPEPYPVYYYPYHQGHAFRHGFFWGVTTAYALGWQHRRLRVVHHSFSGHPYYGHRYARHWWYRRPTLGYHNNLYFRPNTRTTVVRHRAGDYWIPRHTRRSPFVRNRGHAASLTTEHPGSRRYAVGTRSRTTAPSIGSVERGLREQSQRRRAATPVPPSRSRSIEPAQGARYSTRRHTPTPTYRRSEPYRAPVSEPKFSSRPNSSRPPSRPQTSRPQTSRPQSSRPVAPPSRASRQATPSHRPAPSDRRSSTRSGTRRSDR